MGRRSRSTWRRAPARDRSVARAGRPSSSRASASAGRRHQHLTHFSRPAAAASTRSAATRAPRAVLRPLCGDRGYDRPRAHVSDEFVELFEAACRRPLGGRARPSGLPHRSRGRGSTAGQLWPCSSSSPTGCRGCAGRRLAARRALTRWLRRALLLDAGLRPTRSSDPWRGRRAAAVGADQAEHVARGCAPLRAAGAGAAVAAGGDRRRRGSTQGVRRREPALVFLHGTRLGRALARLPGAAGRGRRARRALIYSRAGHGRCSVPDEPRRPRLHARRGRAGGAFRPCCRSAGSRRPVYVGQHGRGSIALDSRFAASGPGSSFLAPHVFVEDLSVASVAGHADVRGHRPGRAVGPLSPRRRRHLPGSGTTSLAPSSASGTSRDVLAGDCTAPTLVVQGDHDRSRTHGADDAISRGLRGHGDRGAASPRLPARAAPRGARGHVRGGGRVVRGLAWRFRPRAPLRRPVRAQLRRALRSASTCLGRRRPRTVVGTPVLGGAATVAERRVAAITGRWPAPGTAVEVVPAGSIPSGLAMPRTSSGTSARADWRPSHAAARAASWMDLGASRSARRRFHDRRLATSRDRGSRPASESRLDPQTTTAPLVPHTTSSFSAARETLCTPDHAVLTGRESSRGRSRGAGDIALAVTEGGDQRGVAARLSRPRGAGHGPVEVEAARPITRASTSTTRARGSPRASTPRPGPAARPDRSGGDSADVPTPETGGAPRSSCGSTSAGQAASS